MSKLSVKKKFNFLIKVVASRLVNTEKKELTSSAPKDLMRYLKPNLRKNWSNH